MKEVFKVGVAKLGRKFSENIGEKNRSDEDNFLIQKIIHSCRRVILIAIYVFSLQGVIYFTSVHMVFDLCLYLIRGNSLIEPDNDRIQK